MSEPFLGEIRIFAGNYAPRGWAFCNGQILPIASNTALFSLLGVAYGGNGTTTFALPNLQGRMPMHMGQGPGLSNRSLGEQVGEAEHSLNAAEMPAHTHGLNGVATATTGTPGPSVALAAGPKVYRTPASTPVTMATGLGATGIGLPHNNQQPLLGLSFIIATEGIFPSRN